MFYQLPPVGNPIRLSGDCQSDVLRNVYGDAYQAHYYATGTTALSAAISAAIRLKNVDKPEVILPAYGCPDLISAALYAGAKPVLVDVEFDRPWMDLEQLPSKINRNTVAIIAVNLFGISERMAQLRKLVDDTDVILIEDSAQSFPRAEESIWQGDLVVLSFGRGKPVSLLGGGAVLCNKKSTNGKNLLKKIPDVVSRVASRLEKIAFSTKVLLFRGMISPRLYWLPQSLPFLHLGETRFHPLNTLLGIDEKRLSLLPSNVRYYQNNSMEVQNKLYDLLSEFDNVRSSIKDLSRLCKTPVDRRLLRYPLLVNTELRDSLFKRLHQSGLGVSMMYPSILSEIRGLEMLGQQGEFPAAVSFSRQLLTLPTHNRVNIQDIEKIRQILMASSK